ncbi:iron complex outermembrane recepter protein [Sphingobium sp. AP50]|nr:iron complex outermembrane recepter protein [Sphingobium sp. AP50]
MGKEFRLAVSPLMASAVALAIASGGTAFAQENNQGFGDIVVTANKREQSLQKVPIAISAFDETAVRAARIENFRDVVLRIPNFYADSVSRTQTSIAMRGAGSLEDSPGSDQAVALFVDEVYVGENSGLDFDFFDVERIEVLRGPQGTLFGRNVMGGAVSIITRKPTTDTTATLEGTFGRFNQIDVRGMLGGALISDTVMGQIAFSSKNSDGYARNEVTGNRLERDNTQSVRGKLRFHPSEDFDANLSVNYMRDKSKGIARKLYGDVPAALNAPDQLDVTQQDMDGGYDRKAYGATLRLDYKLPIGTITSISAYRYGLHRTNVDLDGTPLEIAEFKLQQNRVKQLSQELRLGGTAGDLDYVLGVYYLNVKLRRNEFLTVEGYPGSLFDEIAPGGTVAPEGRGQYINTESYAGFGQFTWHVSDRLRLTGGARYSWEKKSGQTYCLQDGILCSAYLLDVSDHWSALTPKATIDFDVADGIMAYATVARGFKGGGFASDFPDAESARAGGSFDPEFAWSYEAGIKARWFDNHLQTNVTAYRVDYSDLQVRQINGPFTIVGNAGKSQVKGVELEIVARPFAGVEIFGNYAYTDGKYKSLVLEDADYSGNRLILTPKNSFTVGGSYTMEFDADSSLTLRGDVLYKSKSYLDVSNDDLLTAKYDGVVNLSASYLFGGGKWEVSLFGKNVTGVRTPSTAQDYSVFFLSGDDLAAGKRVIATSYNRPTTYGVTLRWKY